MIKSAEEQAKAEEMMFRFRFKNTSGNKYLIQKFVICIGCKYTNIVENVGVDEVDTDDKSAEMSDSDDTKDIIDKKDKKGGKSKKGEKDEKD